MKKLTLEQNEQAADFVKTYGIEFEDIIYFNDKPDPFFTYEATGVLCNQLTDLKDITIEPRQSNFADAVEVCCTIATDERIRSAVGIANINEKIQDQELTEYQVVALASSRAIRNALRLAGIDLVKAHYKAKQTGEVSSIAPAPESTRSKLLAQVHKLGSEAGLIDGKDKSLWRKFLENRYGVDSSQNLSEESLCDLAAVLNTMKPIHTDDFNRMATNAFNRGLTGKAA